MLRFNREESCHNGLGRRRRVAKTGEGLMSSLAAASLARGMISISCRLDLSRNGFDGEQRDIFEDLVSAVQRKQARRQAELVSSLPQCIVVLISPPRDPLFLLQLNNCRNACSQKLRRLRLASLSLMTSS